MQTIQPRTFGTTNRKLEQFFYAHKIRFFYQRKLDDNMTCWYYQITPWLLEVMKEFYRIYRHNDLPELDDIFN